MTPGRSALDNASTYVEQHKIFELFESLMQDTLIAKPDDPIGYLIKLLKREPVPRVVIAGPPGAQARSVCELLAVKAGMVHVIAGQVHQELVRLNFEPAVQAKKLIESGSEVPDALMLAMLKEKLTSGECVSSGWVLEGYPSTAGQARAFLSSGLLPTRFLHVALSDAEVTRRLTLRRVDPTENMVYHLEDKPPADKEVAARLVQRDEDTPQRVAERLHVYRQQMAGVLPAFSKVLSEIDGAAPGGVDRLLELALPLVTTSMPSRAPRGAPRVLLLGGPGSNAETVGSALSLRYGAKLVSAMEIVRAAESNGDKHAKTAMKHPEPLTAIPDKALFELLRQRLVQEDVRKCGFVLVGFPANVGQARLLANVSAIWLRHVVHLQIDAEDALAAVTGMRYDPFDGELYHLQSSPPSDPNVAERLVQHPQHKPAVVKKQIKEWETKLPKLLETYAEVLQTEDAKRPERELVERLAPCFLSL